jgi:hypothetical protein
MAKYPPYVNGYGSIPELFKQITQASVPSKFTNDYLHTMLGLKSSSHRPLIPLLKHLGFLDQGNIPTQIYKSYRDPAKAKGVIASQIKKAYPDLFQSKEFAHKLKKEELQNVLSTLTGSAKDDKTIPAVVGTFIELCKLADFDQPEESLKEEAVNLPETLNSETKKEGIQSKLGISYTINLNLPATTDIEVFNAIFKSLKQNLL